MKNFLNRCKYGMLTFVLSFVYQTMYAQGGGAAGIEAAASEIKGYLEPITNLMYAIGIIVGVIGGIRIYIKWNNGDEINKDIMGWGGAFIFLMLVPTVVKAFFQ